MSSSSSLIPEALLREHRIIPLADDGTTLELGSPEPLPASVVDRLSFLTGRHVVQQRVSNEIIDAFLQQLEPGDIKRPNGQLPGEQIGGESGAREPRTVGDVHASSPPSSREFGSATTPSVPPKDHPRRLSDSDSDVDSRTSASTKPRIALGHGSVVRQVDRIIEKAIDAGASDIHIEPYESFFRVRFRQDGVLHTVGELRLRQRDAIISRLKIMADLDIAEKRRPQDSRIRVEKEGRDIDLRVSTLPTAHGEKVVLRILDKDALSLNLDALGLRPDDRTLLENAIRCPTGQVLVTGPTGSGKTTTLYAALSSLNGDSVNITTIEDPIEFNLPGINQTRVRSDIGFTFAKALRSFLRQDPNVIMVGEIRDQETAQIAVRAALTGHLVFSTLHTNDAPSTVTRLVDMGVEPYLVAASVRLIVAQRLVRTLCPACKTEREGDERTLRRLGMEVGQTVFAENGCEACGGTGFHGRTALFEIMPLSESIGELVSEDASTHRVRSQALDEGLRSLREAAADAVQSGITTPEEALREVAA
jgi:type IV pilus assembly protein PilB